MEKKKVNIRLILFIVFVVVLVGIAVGAIIRTVSSKTEESTGYVELSSEDFASIAQECGYTINDITDTMESYSYIQKAVMAVSEDSTYEVEYYEFTDESSAFNFFDNKESAIYMAIGSKGTYDDTETDEYAKYYGTSDTLYCTVFKIGNTVVCADVKIENKEKLDNVLEKLGYVVKE